MVAKTKKKTVPATKKRKKYKRRKITLRQLDELTGETRNLSRECAYIIGFTTPLRAEIAQIRLNQQIIHNNMCELDRHVRQWMGLMPGKMKDLLPKEKK